MCGHFDLISQSVSYAAKLCLSNVIPALFPFFILSEIFIMSIDKNSFPKAVYALYRKLFKISAATLPVFIAGIVSGYPVGASATYDLYSKGEITKADAERLICFTNNSGPLFVISAVGAGIFGSVTCGIVLYVIHIIASILTGIVVSAKCKTSKYTDNDNKSCKIPVTTIIENSFMKCIKISGFVMLFAIINSAISQPLSQYPLLSAGVCCITEITNGISSSVQLLPLSYSMPLASFALGWSGLSVLMQVKAVSHGKLSTAKYAVCKLFNGAISAVMCYTYVKISDCDTACFAPYSQELRLYPIITPILIGITYIIIAYYWHEKVSVPLRIRG